MPTYDYECKKCGHTFEVFQSMTEEPLKTAFCEACEKRTKVQRVLGAGAGFIFKGSGFYITDYRSKEYQEKAKQETKQADTSSKSDDSGKKKDSAKSKDSGKSATATAN